MHASKVHVSGVYARKVHAYKMHASEVHAHEIYAYEVYVLRDTRSVRCMSARDAPERRVREFIVIRIENGF
jgi:hypothetical protein